MVARPILRILVSGLRLPTRRCRVSAARRRPRHWQPEPQGRGGARSVSPDAGGQRQGTLAGLHPYRPARGRRALRASASHGPRCSAAASLAAWESSVRGVAAAPRWVILAAGLGRGRTWPAGPQESKLQVLRPRLSCGASVAPLSDSPGYGGVMHPTGSQVPVQRSCPVAPDNPILKETAAKLQQRPDQLVASPLSSTFFPLPLSRDLSLSLNPSVSVFVTVSL